MRELHADNQHLKKTMLDLSCMGAQGGDRLGSAAQSQVRAAGTGPRACSRPGYVCADTAGRSGSAGPRAGPGVWLRGRLRLSVWPQRALASCHAAQVARGVSGRPKESLTIGKQMHKCIFIYFLG